MKKTYSEWSKIPHVLVEDDEGRTYQVYEQFCFVTARTLSGTGKPKKCKSEFILDNNQRVSKMNNGRWLALGTSEFLDEIQTD